MTAVRPAAGSSALLLVRQDLRLVTDYLDRLAIILGAADELVLQQDVERAPLISKALIAEEVRVSRSAAKLRRIAEQCW